MYGHKQYTDHAGIESVCFHLTWCGIILLIIKGYKIFIILAVFNALPLSSQSDTFMTLFPTIWHVIDFRPWFCVFTYRHRFACNLSICLQIDYKQIQWIFHTWAISITACRCHNNIFNGKIYDTWISIKKPNQWNWVNWIIMNMKYFNEIGIEPHSKHHHFMKHSIMLQKTINSEDDYLFYSTYFARKRLIIHLK